MWRYRLKLENAGRWQSRLARTAVALELPPRISVAAELTSESSKFVDFYSTSLSLRILWSYIIEHVLLPAPSSPAVEDGRTCQTWLSLDVVNLTAMIP